MTDVHVGRLLAGRYRVERLLGEGARKRVHLAYDTWLDRQVAVCALRADRATPEEVARLRREAAWLAKLGDHPNIVTVHDVVVEGDAAALVCQYLSGGALEDRLAPQGLALAEALSVAADVAAALVHVHAHGLVHRDVKPGNVWLTESGQAVLGDLGLAEVAGGDASGTWPFVGSSGYMAPEQALGDRVDARADLYALGTMLHEMLCGRMLSPRRGEDLASLLLPPEPEPPSRHRSDVPPELDALVRRLLAADAADRPGSAAEVARSLTALAASARSDDAPAPTARLGGHFVGRSPELGELRAALQQAAAGRGGLTLVVGEAGMGKTRTALELVHAASAGGWLVLPGRCHDGDGAPALWPWTQVLRAALRERPEPTARLLSGRAAAALSGVLPELAATGDRPAPPADADSTRFQLFESVAALMRALATEQPVLVVIDDAHWSDAASVALTRFLARQLDDARVALLVCLRDLPGEQDRRVDALDQLTGTAARTVTLTGLPPVDAARFLELSTGVRPADELLHSLHSRTEGNPFFLGELVRLLLAEQRIAADGTLLPGQALIPRGVREVLQRRLAHVSPTCADLLRTASVLGRETRLDVLCRVAESPPERVLPLLDEAARDRLVVPLPGAVPRYRFSHALVHDALYEQLSAVDRSQLHQRAGRTLAAVHAADPARHAAEVAHHYVRGLPGEDVSQAVHWSVQAGRAAAAAAAYEEAATHYGRALSLAESLYRHGPADQPDADSPGMGALLLALGDAQCRAGDTEAGRATFQRAADKGLLEEDPRLLAEAALGYGVGLGGFGFVEHADGLLIALLEQALDALDDSDSALRLRVQARLATELYFTPFRRRRLLLSDEALAMAQRLGDPAGELVALYSRTLARLGPDDVDERRRAAERIVRLATALGDQDMAFRGHHLRLNWAMEAGSLEQVRADVAACHRLAQQQGQPMQLGYAAVFDASLHLLAGSLDDAMQAADAALRTGQRGHAGMAGVLHGAQLLAAHWAWGRLDDVVEAVRAFADGFPHAPAWRAALAFCYAELGRTDAARRELEALAGEHFADLPRDGNYLTALALLAHVVAHVGDRDRAEVLERLLEPYADRHVVIAAGAVAFSSVELPLGLLRATAGDLSAALERLARAQEAHRDRQARPLVVHTAQEQVAVLLRRGAPGDAVTARSLLAEVLPLARLLGMAGHAQRLEALAARLPVQAPPTLLLTDVAGSTALTERLGEREMHQLLREHAQVAGSVAAVHGGTVLKSLGDGLLIVFPDPLAALRCATALQHRSAKAGALRLRIGVHTGEVLREGESLYGRTVILAFRVAGRSRAGEVLVSAATRDALGADDGLRFDPGRRLRLKGFDEPQRVYRLLWSTGSTTG